MAAGTTIPAGEFIIVAGLKLTKAPKFHAQQVYVNKVGSDGWVQTRSPDTAIHPLCKYTQVEVLGSTKARTYFKVLDGPAYGNILSLKDSDVEEYLGRKPPKHGGVELVVSYGKYEEHWYSKGKQLDLDQQRATLTIDKGLQVKVTMNSVWGSPDNFTPIPPGEYTLLLPDSPHDKSYTAFYRAVEPSLKYDQVWFPIKYRDNSRFVHVGNVSEGCVTVVDLDKWADVHEALISHRSADGKSLGKLIVKGKPEKEK